MNHFTTREEWESKPAKRNRLKQLLADPVMVEAFNTIRSLSRPTVAGQLTIESIAIQAARIAGKHDCLDNLIALTRKREKQPEQEDAQSILLTPAEVQKLTEEQNQHPDDHAD